MKRIKKVAIVGSHGLYANYGGWDPLVKNLAEKCDKEEIEYLIFNSVESPKKIECPANVEVKRLPISASGFMGLFYDFWSILICYWRVDTILLLGVQGIPLIAFLSILKKVRIVSNVGGIEWERPKFGNLAKLYLKFCFNLSFRFSDTVILDNQHYFQFIPKRTRANILVIPYGGEIDHSLEIDNNLLKKYPFLSEKYFLSISRALQDNMLDELCNIFTKIKQMLVLISNFSSSEYGKQVMKKYQNIGNIVMINGLYAKPELDLIRRNCKGYIHTHTLCGTAPSLVEMVIAQRPIISIDRPQNRYTLQDNGYFFKDFKEIKQVAKRDCLNEYMPPSELCNSYNWLAVVRKYESELKG